MSAVRGSIPQTTLLQLEIQDPIFCARLMSQQEEEEEEEEEAAMCDSQHY
jgi:hypothetical protein